jgi:outer membrane protein TolC
MPTFRYCVAIGVGAAITLSVVKPSASEELPFLQKPEEGELQPSALTQVEPPTDSSQTPPDDHESTLLTEAENDAKPIAPAVNVSTALRVQSTSQIDTTPQLHPPSPLAIKTETVEPRNDSHSSVNLPLDQGMVNSIPPSKIYLAQNRRTPTPQAPTAPAPLRGVNFDVSPFSASPGVSIPTYLDAGPNPLLFPTQSEEVQIETVQPLTLEQAIDLARRNNRTLEEARITLERTQAALEEALAAEYPTIGVLAQFTRNESAQQRLQNARFGTSPFLDSDIINSSFTGTLQADYDLYTAGLRPAQIRQAEQQIRFQQLEIETTDQQLRLDITNSYYDLQEADAQVEIFQASVQAAAQSLRDAQLLEQAGLGTRFDVLQAQVDLADANQNLVRALNQRVIARRQLAQLLSLPQTAGVTAADPIAVAGEWPLSLEQSIVLAYKNRAELEQQLVQRDIGEQQRRIALAAIRPQASLSAGYSVVGVFGDDQGAAGGLSLGATLRWNFFDGGAARARAEQAQKNIAIAETRFAGQRDQVRFEVEQAFYNLNANAQNIQTATTAAQQAEESLRLARLRFQAGVGTQTDVINQQTALTRARVNQLTAILDYNRALANLQRATSDLPDSSLYTLP